MCVDADSNDTAASRKYRTAEIIVWIQNSPKFSEKIMQGRIKPLQSGGVEADEVVHFGVIGAQ